MTRYPLVPLGEVLTHRKQFTFIDDALEYKRVRVKLHQQGIELRDVVWGADIKTKKQQICRAGDVLFAEIDAKVGGYGVVPSTLDGAIVSSHYFLYDLNESKCALPFVEYALRWPAFHDQVRAQGSTNYAAIRPHQVLEYRIPLPPIDEQRRIVGVLEGTAGRINLLRATYERFGALAKHVVATATLMGGTHPGSRTVLLGDVLSPVRDSVRVEPDREYPNVGILSFARGLFEKPPVEGSRTSASALFRIRTGQFIYSRLFAFEGAYALVDERFDGYFVSNEFPVFDIDEAQVDPSYLLSYFSSPRIWEELATGSVGLGVRRQRVKPEVLLTHQIRLPPLTEQKRIGTIAQKVSQVESRRSHALALTDAIGLAMLNQTFSVLR